MLLFNNNLDMTLCSRYDDVYGVAEDPEHRNQSQSMFFNNNAIQP